MNRFILYLLMMVVLVMMESQVEAKVKLDQTTDRQAYALGYTIAKGLHERDTALSSEALMLGMKDGFKGKGSLTDNEIQTAMVNYQDGVRLKQIEANKKALLENESKGKTFLVDNSKKAGVITLASGLQYKVVQSGNGTVSPKPAQTVTVHYRGTLINGTEFDSSYSRGEPIKFPVNRVIAGWTEALQLMTVGDKWKLFIPSDLAYGAQGAGASIGPNETLIFEVELLGIQ
jgi:FKBP-type peptidyl-prolyl cis-trans isomerase FklB